MIKRISLTDYNKPLKKFQSKCYNECLGRIKKGEFNFGT